MKNENKFDQPIEGHEYDGISELDNPLPSWWLGTFYITIIFSFIYFIHIHLTPNNLIVDEYNEALKQNQKATVADSAKVDDASLETVANSPEKVAQGKQRFQAVCSSCHGAEGQGGIGPNLTDKFWIHGAGTLSDIVKVVQEGVLDKGMPAWGQVLKSNEVLEVVAYVKTLQGTNPAGAKAPQGTEIK